ncbi:PREDICTED: protein N-terminal glutamine amidohydrolase-like [Camelina sativa]|uniref:Protein N-terminal glutamine amidohydrolase n=1 Tax=Camelina sativa TaxID=90675 RepID=A0ABM0Z0D2_CAMSA|nr:PREDICTED: protein N-terminal glutamine amidohydrolase-like [Camelina sativa]
MSSVTSEHVAMEATRFQHTPYYCEENVYLLCKTLCENGVADATGSDLFVVFISNEKKQVPLWHQKASRRADGIVLWDYHVICVQRKKESDSEPLVWDLDSTLPFPSPLTSYVAETIQPSFQLYAEYQRFFRVVHAPLFFKHFASDRRHMKEPDGSWTAQPPPYEPIVAQGKM